MGVAAGDDVCCYMGCSQKPASCNPVGHYCSLSSDNCVNNCAGEWCPDSPPPPSPTPTPPPPTPTPSGATYCPDPSNDFFAEYGNVQWSSSGWTIYGNARVSSKASLNLVGGFLEFDMELSGAHGGVNNNLYATFPQGGNQGIGSYCDLVVLVPLVVPRWTSQKTTVTVFRQPRGTLLVMGATTMVQLTQAPSVLACTSVRTGLRAIPSPSLWTAVSAAATVSQMSWQRMVQSFTLRSGRVGFQDLALATATLLRRASLCRI